MRHRFGQVSEALPIPAAASIRARLGARLIDAITLTWALGFVLVELDQRLLGGDPFGRQPLQVDVTQGRSLLFVVVTIAAYEVIPTVLKGATLGKALVGLRLRTVEPSARIPWSRATARALVLYGGPVAFGAYGRDLPPGARRERCAPCQRTWGARPARRNHRRCASP